MFWRRRKRPPGPTGTGIILENIDWLFWDDAHSPGLIHQSKFSRLSKIALPEIEYGEYVRARMEVRIVSNGGRPSMAAVTTEQRYHAKVAEYLVRMRENRPDAIAYWIDTNWDERIEGDDGKEGMLLLKALLNVLRHWNYPLDWRDAYDSSANLAMLVVSKNATRHERWRRSVQSPLHYVAAPHDRIEYCVHRDEIMQITGRPYHFTVQLRDATWRFEQTKGELAIERIPIVKMRADVESDEYDKLLRAHIEKLVLRDRFRIRWVGSDVTEPPDGLQGALEKVTNEFRSMEFSIREVGDQEYEIQMERLPISKDD